MGSRIGENVYYTDFDPDEVPEEWGDSGHHRLRASSSGDEKQGPFAWIPVRYGQWVSEAALWTIWENVGELSTRTDCVMLCIDGEQLAKTLKPYEKAFVDTAIYARDWVAHMNHSVCTDLGM